MDKKRDILRRFCIAWSRVGRSYSHVTQAGLKDSMLWLLYALDDGESHSQKTICEEWGIPRTTMNTTIKVAEREGYLTLTPIPGKRREMSIRLTPKGAQYAAGVLEKVYEAEERALDRTVQKYSADFVDAMNCFAECLEENLRNSPKGKIASGTAGDKNKQK